MLTLGRIITALFLLLALGFAAAKPATAASANLGGTIYVIDAAGQTITLKDATGALTALTITSKSKLTRNGKKVTVAGLVVGDQASAVTDTSNNIVQLGAKGPVVITLTGSMVTVNSGTGAIQIDTGKSNKNARTSANTRIVRNGQLASLNSLTPFDSLTTHVAKSSSRKRSPAQSSQAQDAMDIQAEGPEEAEISGTITAVTPANPGNPAAIPPVAPTLPTITVTPAGGSPITLTITADTLINLDGAAATAADLTIGMSIEAEYDPTTLNAFRIEADQEGDDAEIEGTITALDTLSCAAPVPTPCSVTITNAGGAVTLTVDASTKIKINDTPALLSDLMVGDAASAEYNAVTLVAHELEVEIESETEAAGGTESGGGAD